MPNHLAVRGLFITVGGAIIWLLLWLWKQMCPGVLAITSQPNEAGVANEEERRKFVEDLLYRLLADTSTRYTRIYTRAAFNAAIREPSSVSDAEGFLYWQILRHRDGSQELKAGRTKNIQRRLAEWRRQCYLADIVHAAEIPTKHAKKLERIVHMFFKINDAWIEPYACDSCGVRHREKFEPERVGGIEQAVEVSRLLNELVDLTE
ncbi:hypothetical protein B0H11DRAFT_1934412 [Mycena galericulata]|nr:hypothetical protein B0H11DRAFT_1934412 [Mycena galericulata]